MRFFRNTLILLAALTLSGCCLLREGPYGKEFLKTDADGKQYVVYESPQWATEVYSTDEGGVRQYVFPVPDGVDPKD